MAKPAAKAGKKGKVGSAKPKRSKAPARPAEPTVEPRRVPTQARSKERVARIVDAAAEVFGEVGFDAATMEDIARRADTSIGSVYQFFPNKRSLFEALAQQYFERSERLFAQILETDLLAKPWPEICDAVIDAFWTFHVDQPGFRSLWAHQNISPEVLEAADAVNRTISERGAIALEAFAPHLPKERRRLVVSVAVETVSAMLFVAVRRERREARELVDETKLLVRAYFEKVIGGG